MTDDKLKELFPYEVKKTINDVFQPWIAKWGIDECRDLILALETAGYVFIEKENLDKLNKAVDAQQKGLDDYFKRVEERNKSIRESNERFDARMKEIDEEYRIKDAAIQEKYRIIAERRRNWWRFW